MVEYLPRYCTFLLYLEDFDNVFPRERLEVWLNRKCEHWAYIVHDNPVDLSEDKPHIHVFCEFDRRRCEIMKDLPSAVARDRWRKVKDTSGVALYLTHESKDAVAKNKLVYDRSLVVTDDSSWLDAMRDSSADDPAADAFSIYDDAIEVVSGRLPLRDFISLHPSMIYRLGTLKVIEELEARSSSREYVKRSELDQTMCYVAQGVRDMQILEAGLSAMGVDVERARYLGREWMNRRGDDDET